MSRLVGSFRSVLTTLLFFSPSSYCPWIWTDVMITQKERTNRGRVVDPRPGSSVKRATRDCAGPRIPLICLSAALRNSFRSVASCATCLSSTSATLCYMLSYRIVSADQYHQNSSSIFAAACYQVSLALPDPNLAQQASSSEFTTYSRRVTPSPMDADNVRNGARWELSCGKQRRKKGFKT
jgi:hypothetical protein